MILEKIKNVKDLRKLDIKELESLSGELRNYIIDVISKNGGHLASSLGVVELTIALHYAFDTPADKLIWDVGHQTYAHKILTGRKKEFSDIRKFGCISGFPKRLESKFDTFCAGHSSTSLSLALGLAVNRDLKNQKHKVIAVIGDGSLTGGMALEALNHIGHLDNDILIILNDNEQSISENVGGISSYLTRIISSTFYNKFRKKSMDIVRKIPKFGNSIFNFLYRIFHLFKGMLIPGQFFEDMGIRYFGPVNGHDIKELIDLFESFRKINSGPKIIHVITKKGKGYLPAELNPSKFHGISKFDIQTGTVLSKNWNYKSYSEIAGETLAYLSKKDKSIVAITAAMKLGTGLYEFEKKKPSNFFDVGIAEQHAITFAGGLASSGAKPFVSIYSTFLQRAIDQLIHDIAIMNLPIKLLIDRSGIVGDDGETHHGLFDISIIKNVPNFIFLAPSSGDELRDMIYFASTYDKGPIAIRFPRGKVDIENFLVEKYNEFVLQKIKKIKNGNDIAIFTLGDMVKIAMETSEILHKKGISVSVINLLTLKPLDIAGIERVIRSVKGFLTLENGIISGGIGESILANIKPQYREKFLFFAGFPDQFIPHGTVSQLFEEYGLDPISLSKKIIKNPGL
jgi:1-deoxy-D-xylulose-5-phosphate synthase